ncbi:MAG: phage tail tape measure protein [Pseudomonadota bacterium]
MTRSLRAKFLLDMGGNLDNQARRFGNAFRRLGDRGDRELGRVGRAARRLDRGLNRALVGGAAAAGAALGAGVALSIRRLGTLEQRLERLGITAGKSSKEMARIRDEVNEVANDPDILIAPEQIFAALDAFTARTGDFDFGNSIKREMGVAIQATGIAGEEIGNLVAVMSQSFGLDNREGVLAGLDTLAKQGKAGAVELANLARVGPKAFSAFSRTGGPGIEGLARSGALLQTFIRGVGSSEEATTVLENVINNLSDPTRLKKLEKAGIATQTADGRERGPVEMLRAVITAFGGNDRKLKTIFDAEAFRGVGLLSKEFRETGGFGSLDALIATRGTGSTITGDSSRIAGTFNASGQRLVNTVNDRIEDNLMGPLQDLTDSLNALIDKGVKFTLDDAANVALGAAGALVVGKAGLMALGAGRGPRVSRGAAAAGAAGSFAAQPVFVTNWPAKLLLGGGTGLGGDTAADRSTKRKASGGRSLGRILGSLPLVATGVVAAGELPGAGPRHTELQADLQRRQAAEAARAASRRSLVLGRLGLGSADPAGADGSGEVRALLEGQDEQTGEISDGNRRILAALGRLERRLANLPNSSPSIDPAGDTGRTMVGP